MEMFSKIVIAFEQGGFWMWPILVTQLVAIAIIVERVYALYFKNKVNQGQFVTQFEEHIRRGDFRPLASNEDFARVGGVQTPNDYFLSVIAGIRRVAGHDVPVTVFSDGSDTELAFILSLPNVTRSQTENDVVDLLLMSRAQVIVPSAGSTFSEWAGFLSDAIIVRHPDHIHAPIRSPSLLGGAFESAAPATADQWASWWKRANAVLAADASMLHFLDSVTPAHQQIGRAGKSAA